MADPIDADALRIRHEFLTLPGLHASVDSCARLLNIPARHAKAILDSLVGDGFLERIGDEGYARNERAARIIGRQEGATCVRR